MENEFFFIDGKIKSFADVILSKRIVGDCVFVASYGFGVKQVRRLMSAFDNVVLVADESHSKLNKKAYDSLVGISKVSSNFEFRPIVNHAKFAIVDNEIMIFTSANLSQNGKVEVYSISPVSVGVLDKIELQFGNMLPSPVDELFGFDRVT